MLTVGQLLAALRDVDPDTIVYLETPTSVVEAFPVHKVAFSPAQGGGHVIVLEPVKTTGRA